MMYRKLFFILLLVAMCFPVAMASVANVNTTFATLGTNVIFGDTIAVENPATICAAYGQPVFGGYTGNITILFNQYYPTLDTGSKWYYLSAREAIYPGTFTLTDTVPNTPQFSKIFSQAALCDTGGHYYSIIEHPYYNNSAYAESQTNTTFIITDTANFTTKLSGVQVTLSNGQYGTTDAQGNLTIRIYPPSSAYTYSLIKTGYTTKLSQPLGGYGETGGTLYDTMDVATGYLPAGYIRTTVHTIDALTGSQISGTTINLRDVENNSWVNSTADADGELIIDVLESHTLDVYGSYPGVFTESQELGAVPGGDYYLPMYATLPTPADGYVNVLTYVTSAVDDGPISNAKVVYTYIDGSLKGQKISTVTDNWGASLAVLKNATVVVIDVSKPNYNGQSASHTLPNFADVMYTFRLSKGGMITAVPTVTDPATGAVITAVPTYLPYCDPSRGDYDEALCGHSKDNALFGQLRESGSAIIGLCILAIIFGLLKMIMKF